MCVEIKWKKNGQVENAIYWHEANIYDIVLILHKAKICCKTVPSPTTNSLFIWCPVHFFTLNFQIVYVFPSN